MEGKPKQSAREGKRAAQFFVAPASLARFKAACAFAEADMTEVVERFMNEYADKAGIPVAPAAKPGKRNSARPK